MKRIIIILVFFLYLFTGALHAQTIPRDELVFLTSEWKGERFADGRPKVPDKLLERLKAVRLEEAWGILRNKGYQNQFEGDWMVLHSDSVMTGRVVTAQYLPARPDVDKIIKDIGKIEGRIGNTN